MRVDKTIFIYENYIYSDIDMMDEPANSRHNDSRTNEEIQVLADPHNRRDDGRLCALLFCPQEFQYRHAEHRGYIRHNQGPTGLF